MKRFYTLAKKVLAIVLTITLAAAVFPVAVLGAQTDTGVQYEIINGKAYITGYRGSELQITLPETIDRYPVAGIGVPDKVCSWGFVQEITLPSSIKTVSKYAFFGDLYISKVVIPEGVTRLEAACFSGCNNLMELVLPASLTYIDKSALTNCGGLENIIIAEGNPAYSAEKHMLFNADKTVLYRYCSVQPKSVILPDTVIEIAESAFESQSLGTVALPEGLLKIGDFAFAFTEVKELNIPSTVTEIGDYAFYDCEGVGDNDLPEALTSLGDYALYGTEMAKVTIPKNLTHIGKAAFYFSLKHPSYAISAAENAAYKVVDHVLFTADGETLIWYPNSNPSETYHLPEGTRHIADYAFSNAVNLKEITLNEGLESIGDNCFYYNSQLTAVVLPDSLTQLGKSAFRFCDGLETLVLGKGIKAIPEGCFGGCDGLTRVAIPDGVTVIESEAFSYCEALTEVSFGSNVHTIENGAFDGTALMTAFEDDEASEMLVADHCILAIKNNFDLALEKDIRVLAANVIPHLQSVSIDPANPYFLLQNNVLFSADKTRLLWYSPKLTHSSYTLLETVTVIGDHAFSESQYLENVHLPSGLTAIGELAFFRVTNLAQITIPGSVIEIGAYAFRSCHFMRKAVLEEGVESIRQNAFVDCANLREVYLPASLSHIGSDAFEYDYDAVFYCRVGTFARNYCEQNNLPCTDPLIASPGDVNMDNRIDAVDALMVLQYAVGKLALSEDAFPLADMNLNGWVNAADALLVLQKAVYRY